MKNKESAWCLALLTAVTLTACSGKNDVSEGNFSTALNQYLETNGDLCLGVGPFPVDVTESDIRAQAQSPAPGALAARMAALQQAGLVSSVEVALGQLSYADARLTGHRTIVRRYDLTTGGRDAYRKIVGDALTSNGKTQSERGDICYGKLAVDSVKNWDGPTHVNGAKEVAVNYTYKLSNVAAWANAPEIKQAFPAVVNVLSGAGAQVLATTLVLGDKGWIAKAP